MENSLINLLIFTLLFAINSFCSECSYGMQFLEKGTRPAYMITGRHLKSHNHLPHSQPYRIFSEPVNGNKYPVAPKKHISHAHMDERLTPLLEDNSPFNFSSGENIPEPDDSTAMANINVMSRAKQFQIKKEVAELFTNAAAQGDSNARFNLRMHESSQDEGWPLTV